MVPRENKNNAYSKFGWTNKKYYGIFRFGQLLCLCPRQFNIFPNDYFIAKRRGLMRFKHFSEKKTSFGK